MDTKENSSFSFDNHMAQWSRDFKKPLITPSTNVEFDMPYCYSEEYYNKAKGFEMQPFGNIGEPLPSGVFKAHFNEWEEKSQLALNYYRQLREQRSCMPPQILVIKNSSQLAQYVAATGQNTHIGAEVFFRYHNRTTYNNINISVFEEKENQPSTSFLEPEQDHNSVTTSSNKV